MADENLKEFARRGVQAEIERLMRILDDLGGIDHRSQRLDEAAPPKSRRAGRRMTAAQRKEVSRRMKAMWAAKRKQKGA